MPRQQIEQEQDLMPFEDDMMDQEFVSDAPDAQVPMDQYPVEDQEQFNDVMSDGYSEEDMYSEEDAMYAEEDAMYADQMYEDDLASQYAILDQIRDMVSMRNLMPRR